MACLSAQLRLKSHQTYKEPPNPEGSSCSARCGGRANPINGLAVSCKADVAEGPADPSEAPAPGTPRWLRPVLLLGSTMSGPQAPEPTLEGQADASAGSPDEDAAEGIQHSHRMLSFSDALLSIIATVMVRGGPRLLRGGRGGRASPSANTGTQGAVGAQGASLDPRCVCCRSCP